MNKKAKRIAKPTNTAQTMVRAVWNLNSRYLLNRSGHAGGDRGLSLYTTDKHIKRGLGIHRSSRQGYRVQVGWGRAATSPDQNIPSNNAS